VNNILNYLPRQFNLDYFRTLTEHIICHPSQSLQQLQFNFLMIGTVINKIHKPTSFKFQR